MPSQRHFALLSPHETRPHSEVGWAISIGLACVAATALLLLLWVGGQALLLKLDERERIKAEARAAGLTPAQVAMLDAGRCGRGETFCGRAEPGRTVALLRRLHGHTHRAL